MLFDHLNDDKIEIEVWKQVLGTIVDTYCIVKGEFSPYFDQLWNSIQQMMEKSIQILDKFDKDEMNIAKLTQVGIIENLTEITFAL